MRQAQSSSMAQAATKNVWLREIVIFLGEYQIPVEGVGDVHCKTRESINGFRVNAQGPRAKKNSFYRQNRLDL
jgi:hypothetical protein